MNKPGGGRRRGHPARHRINLKYLGLLGQVILVKEMVSAAKTRQRQWERHT